MLDDPGQNTPMRVPSRVILHSPSPPHADGSARIHEEDGTSRHNFPVVDSLSRRAHCLFRHHNSWNHAYFFSISDIDDGGILFLRF